MTIHTQRNIQPFPFSRTASEHVQYSLNTAAALDETCHHFFRSSQSRKGTGKTKKGGAGGKFTWGTSYDNVSHISLQQLCLWQYAQGSFEVSAAVFELVPVASM